MATTNTPEPPNRVEGRPHFGILPQGVVWELKATFAGARLLMALAFAERQGTDESDWNEFTARPRPARNLDGTPADRRGYDHGDADGLRLGDLLPPLWHWLYFLPLHRQSQIGPDGHARRGGFLPPVPSPRRKWAGGRFQFGEPLRVGESVRRTSTIADVSVKEGRSGTLISYWCGT